MDSLDKLKSFVNLAVFRSDMFLLSYFSTPPLALVVGPSVQRSAVLFDTDTYSTTVNHLFKMLFKLCVNKTNIWQTSVCFEAGAPFNTQDPGDLGLKTIRLTS